MFEIEIAAKLRVTTMLAAGALAALLAVPALAQDASEPPAAGSDIVIDFSAPAEEDDLIDAAEPFVAPQSRAVPGRHAAERRIEARRQRGRDFQTFDTADGEEGRYWYGRAARPERMERRGSFTVITLRTRRAAVPEVTLVPGDVAYSSEAGLAPISAGPAVIDVEAERLDRRPYGPDGLDIVSRGGPKIIRISPDY
jgi:hypothetical protein